MNTFKQDGLPPDETLGESRITLTSEKYGDLKFKVTRNNARTIGLINEKDEPNEMGIEVFLVAVEDTIETNINPALKKANLPSFKDLDPVKQQEQLDRMPNAFIDFIRMDPNSPEGIRLKKSEKIDKWPKEAERRIKERQKEARAAKGLK